MLAQTTSSLPSLLLAEDCRLTPAFRLVYFHKVTMTTSQLKSFPPLDDSIDFIKQVDWTDVQIRTKNGLKNVLLMAAAFSEKSFEFHIWLAKKLG